MDTNRGNWLPRMTLIVAALVLIAGGLAACGDDDDDNNDDGNGEPTATTAAGGAGSGEANTVQVSLTEFAIDMPDTLPAGPTTFEVTNDGTVEHNFEVEGEGIEEEFEANLQPGETMTLEIDLQPGAYNVYCPVGDHHDQGMHVELTVT
jgi:uncharacterized cupredoxin-like copper-binding protein